MFSKEDLYKTIGVDIEKIKKPKAEELNKLYMEIAQQKGLGWDNNKANAFQHAYQSALDLDIYDEKTAIFVGEFVEWTIWEDANIGDINKDLWNNRMGIEFAKKYSNLNKEDLAMLIFEDINSSHSQFIVDANDKRKYIEDLSFNKLEKEIKNKILSGVEFKKIFVQHKNITKNVLDYYFKKYSKDLKSIFFETSSFLQIEKSIQDKLKDFPIKDEHLNYKFPELNFNLPSLDLNFKKTDSKQSLIQQKPLFNLENFNFTKEEIRQATNITLPSAITSHPEIVIKSNYNKATNTRVNNIDLNFGKITINSDEDIKNLAYYCCDLAHNLEQCVLSKIKRELQIQQ